MLPGSHCREAAGFGPLRLVTCPCSVRKGSSNVSSLG